MKQLWWLGFSLCIFTTSEYVHAATSLEDEIIVVLPRSPEAIPEQAPGMIRRSYQVRVSSRARRYDRAKEKFMWKAVRSRPKLQMKRYFNQTGVLKFKLQNATREELDNTINELRLEHVDAVIEPNRPIRLSSFSSPFSRNWGLDNANKTSADVSAREALALHEFNSDVKVAVIDTGVDYFHRDLKDQIWTNLGEIEGNGIDDDGNGYVDDVYGYNFKSSTADTMDRNGHGTHVAGIIAAVAGFNPKIKIMPIKFLDSTGDGSIAGAIEAIDYALRMGANILNYSWGGEGHSEALQTVIQDAYGLGALHVAAAGNDGSNNDRSAIYPATFNLPNLISVAATDQFDQLWRNSNFGPQTTQLAAPGVSIYSTYPNDEFDHLSGTSQAAPYVTGVAALVWAAKPDLNLTQVRSAITEGVDSLYNLRSKVATGGRLNAESSVSIALGLKPETLPSYGNSSGGLFGACGSLDVRHGLKEIRMRDITPHLLLILIPLCFFSVLRYRYGRGSYERDRRRYEYDGKVVLQINNERAFVATSSDICQHGVGITTHIPLKRGDRISARIQTSNQKWVEVEARVQWRNKSKQRYGLQFVEVKENELFKLENLLTGLRNKSQAIEMSAS